jgi:amino acid transporter
VLGAALLAFYAFLGFEDMVNVAEEVRDVRRTLPLAIGLTLAGTVLLYVLLASVAVLSTDPAALAASDAPLAVVVRHEPAAATAISLIGVIAMVNGALIQVIMASRVLYGMASQRGSRSALARIHPKTRTPIRATVLVAGGVLLLALLFPLGKLAEATSVTTLLVFALVNAALLRVKRDPQQAPPAISVPGWLPVVGLATSSGFLF